MTHFKQSNSNIESQLNADWIDHRTQVFIINEAAPQLIKDTWKLDCPSLPRSFLRRRQPFERIIETVLSDDFGFAIVTGSSGSGKSSAAADAYVHLLRNCRLVGTWIDCRQIVENEIDFTLNGDVGRNNLIVLDTLNDENHPVIIGGFLDKYKTVARIIVITTSQNVVRKVLQVTGLADRVDDVLTTLRSFSTEECLTFLEKASGARLESSQIDWMMDLTRGYPILCQMINEVMISEGCSCSDLLTSYDYDSSIENKGLSWIINYWLSSCVKQENVDDVLNCLLHLPFIGMELFGVVSVTGLDVDCAQKALQKLLNIGIVSSVSIMFSPGHKMFFVHSVLRSLRDELPMDLGKLLRWRENYISELQLRLKEGPRTSRDTVLCLDAWISGWASAFIPKSEVDTDPSSFKQRLDRYENLLPHILPAVSICFRQADELASILKPYISREMHCAPLTGLGHMLRDVKPNYLIADIMWNAVENDDSWGRASALGVCISHWQRLGSSARTMALSRLNRWFEVAYTNVRATKWECGGVMSPGLDVLVALAGLARLSDVSALFTRFSSPQYQTYFSECYAVNCMILVRAFESGLLAYQWRRGIGFQLIERAFSDLNEVYLRTFDFLVVQQIDPELKMLLSHLLRTVTRDPEEISLSLDIAKYSDCMPLLDYVRKHEPQARLHF
jgi:hypothetical protein